MERLFWSADIAISFPASWLISSSSSFCSSWTKRQRGVVGKCSLQPQDINIKQSFLHLTSQRPVGCGKRVEIDCFFHRSANGNVSRAEHCMFVRLWREKHSASRWVSSIFCCASATVNWTLNDQFGSEEPVINELMVEIPMFSLCDVRALKLALTACLSGPQLSSSPCRERASSMCVSVCLDVRGCGRSWHTAWRFQIFMVRNMLWKRSRTRSRTHAYQRESIGDKFTSLDAAYFYWTHFLREIALIVSVHCSLISQKGGGKKKRKTHTADFCQVCALIFLWSQTPQSNYKISLINTALDHKHDTEDPSSHSPFLK